MIYFKDVNKRVNAESCRRDEMATLLKDVGRAASGRRDNYRTSSLTEEARLELLRRGFTVAVKVQTYRTGFLDRTIYSSDIYEITWGRK